MTASGHGWRHPNGRTGVANSVSRGMSPQWALKRRAEAARAAATKLGGGSSGGLRVAGASLAMPEGEKGLSTRGAGREGVG